MSLGTLEFEILNSIWKLQAIDEDMNISVKDVVDNMSANGLERAYTTVKTVMDRLSSKDLLVRYRAGKNSSTKPLWIRMKWLLQLLKNFLDNSLITMQLK